MAPDARHRLYCAAMHLKGERIVNKLRSIIGEAWTYRLSSLPSLDRMCLTVKCTDTEPDHTEHSRLIRTEIAIEAAACRKVGELHSCWAQTAVSHILDCSAAWGAQFAHACCPA